MTKEQKRKKREREREKKNSTPVIAQTSSKMLLHKFFSRTINRLLFLWMHYFRWMSIFKNFKSFSRFFLCSGMKLEFVLLLDIKE